MSCPLSSRGLRLRRGPGSPGVALIITLALLTVATVLLLTLVSQTRSDLGASHHYTQASAATELGMAGLEFVVNQFQQEMGKDQAPDLTYPASPLYTNVAATNLFPQPVGTNSAMPLLVKISTNAPPFTGSRASGTLVASTVGTAAVSLNGRTFPASRWNAPCLGAFPTTAIPSWVLMTRGGPNSGAALSFAGNAAVNNAAVGNTNFAIGRFAYAAYDVSGLLDITVAGYPPGSLTTAGQLQAIKGTLAGADVSALGIDAAQLTTWRNAASAASAASYLDFVTNFAATNGFKGVYPGDTTFLSRQELIKAAQAGTAGLNTNLLSSLTVFSRERNAPSWWPQGTSATVPYAALAATATSTNVFVPLVRYAATNTVASYKIDGVTTNQYKVYPGDPLVYSRFPLDRIRWISSSGPAHGASAKAIQSCFGLLWNAATGVWQYVGPTGTTELSAVETLSQVAAEATPREPNFFELLQAGILSGSLGSELHGTLGGAYNSTPAETFHDASPLLHLFRIGASILTQYQPDACPIVVEYKQPKITLNGLSYAPLVPWQAAGVANLPYFNMMSSLGGTSPDDVNSVAIYLAVGLWNPHQGSGTITTTRPPVRLHLIGSVSVGDFFGGYPGNAAYGLSLVPENTGLNGGLIPGYTYNLDTTVLLSSSAGGGANGFVDPHVALPADFSPAPGPGTAAGLAWATFQGPGPTTYAAYRLPDFKLDPTYKSDSGTPSAAATGNVYYGNMNFWVNNSVLHPFNVYLEFQNPQGTWVPYNYFNGINDSLTWFSKSPGIYVAGLGVVPVTSPGVPAIPIALSDLSATGAAAIDYYYKGLWEAPDPRSLRYNYVQHNSTAIWPAMLNSSFWSSLTESGAQTYGRAASQVSQKYFGGGVWTPAGLARNNNQASFTTNSATSPAAYYDPDGVARIADSGLFTATPAAGNGWQGDPYALSTTRTADRPIVLNRPFASVGELGYVNRDYPWRTLDMSSTNSADAGLLDLFTVSQSSDPVARGRINPNRANAAALEAILRNTLSSVVLTNSISKPSAIATNLATFTATSTNRITGRDQLATRLVSGLAAANFSSTDEQNVKALREGTTRALADVSQTRTWNLLIDLVAQSGRYPTAATALDQFVVDGEQRFWLHVAIDRYTGKVIDQQLEVVTP